MIGKRALGRVSAASVEDQVRALAAYIDREGPDLDRGEILAQGATGLVSISRAGQIAEIAAVAMGAPRARAPIEHLILSWHDGEYPDHREVAQAVAYVLLEAEIAGHQAIWSLHKARNVHLHLVINRVCPGSDRPTKVAFWHNAIGRAVARIEHAQGWTREPGARFEIIGGTNDKQPEVTARTTTGYDRDRSRRGLFRSSGDVRDIEASQGGKRRDRSSRGDDRHDGDHEQQVGRALAQAAADTPDARRARLIAEVRLRAAHMALPAGAIVAQEIASADALSTAAANVEIRLGKASAERIAIEVAGPIIDAASSWPDLHAHLAAEGIQYRQKGSGAVLYIGDEIVKASTYRKAALGALVKRLGPFEPSMIQATPRPAEPAPGVAPELFDAIEKRKTEIAEINTRAAEFTAPIAFAPKLAKIIGGTISTNIDIERLAYEIGAPAPVLAPLRQPLAPVHDPKSAFGRYHANVDAQEYRLIFIKEASGARPGKAFFIPFSPINELALHEKIVGDMARDRAQLFIDPRSDNTHHVVITGLTKSNLGRIASDGFAPALVTQLAPDRFEVLIKAPREGLPHSDDAKSEVEDALNRQYGAGARQSHRFGQRFPGTAVYGVDELGAPAKNVVRIIKFATRQFCAKLGEMIHAQIQAIETRLRALSSSRWSQPQTQTSSATVAAGVQAYAAHFDDIIAGGGSRIHLSSVDAAIAVRLRATGHARERVEGIIAAVAPKTDPARSYDWAYYAQRMADYAFSADSRAKAKFFEGDVAHWKHVESTAMEVVQAHPNVKREHPKHKKKAAGAQPTATQAPRAGHDLLPVGERNNIKSDVGNPSRGEGRRRRKSRTTRPRRDDPGR